MSARSRTMQLSAILGVTALIFLLDLFFLFYETSHGLNPAQSLASASLIPIDWLPVIGVVVLSLATWYEAYYRIFPRRGFEVDPLGRIRLARAVLFSLTLFVLILYVPTLIRSSWFWGAMSGVVQLHGFANALLNDVAPLLMFDLVWEYAGLQILAAAVMILGAWAFARTTRRVRK